MPLVSIIILVYKDKQEMIECLRSVSSQKTKYSYEVILVDNGGDKFVRKEVLKVIKNFRYIKSSKDLGYGNGNNVGIENAKGKYMFILNPDTTLFPKALDLLVEFMVARKGVAISAPILLDSNGKIIKQISEKILTPLRQIFTYSFVAKLLPNNKIKREFINEKVGKIPYEVEVVPGSAFLIRKSVFDNLGGFDKNYFLYFEENDLCQRIKEVGYKIYKIPKAKVFHNWHPSGGSEYSKNIFENSRFYYFKKHYGLIKAIIVELFSRKWWSF